MISRLRTKKGRVQLPLRQRPNGDASQDLLLPPRTFELAIAKECCRSERRDLIFCIVVFDFDDGIESLPRDSISSLAKLFRKRLRLIDEIGIHQETLAVLLPETTPAGAAVVANDLTDLGRSKGIQLSTEIFVYPESSIAGAGVDSNQHGAGLSKEFPPGGFPSSNEAAGPFDKTKAEGEEAVDVIEGSTDQAQAFKLIQPTPWWKRCLDLGGASLGLVVLAPLFILIAVGIKITSKGPVLYTQWREGKDGRVFRIYKFRTMLIDADQHLSAFRELSEQDGPAFKLKDDPRITPLGRYLRKCCADELPQLFNVLRGEMSLVGPRPLPLEESYQCEIWQRRRLDVLPGLTCFWQVDGGREVPFDEWMRMDIAYTRSRNFFTDAKLIFKTVLVTILHRGSV